MDYGKHLLGGFLIGFVFIIFSHWGLGWFDYNFKSICLYILIIAVYSLLPDSDHRNSLISFIFIGVSILGMIYGYVNQNNSFLYSFFALLIVTFIAWTLGHRGFVHSIIFALIVSSPLIYFFNYKLAILAFLCFYSHLILDEEYFKII